MLLITPNVIRPIQRLKVDYLGSKNPRLHMEEVLIALSASTETDPLADLALKQLPRLRAVRYTVPVCSVQLMRRPSRSWES